MKSTLKKISLAEQRSKKSIGQLTNREFKGLCEYYHNVGLTLSAKQRREMKRIFSEMLDDRERVLQMRQRYNTRWRQVAEVLAIKQASKIINEVKNPLDVIPLEPDAGGPSPSAGLGAGLGGALRNIFRRRAKPETPTRKVDEPPIDAPSAPPPAAGGGYQLRAGEKMGDVQKQIIPDIKDMKIGSSSLPPGPTSQLPSQSTTAPSTRKVEKALGMYNEISKMGEKPPEKRKLSNAEKLMRGTVKYGVVPSIPTISGSQEEEEKLRIKQAEYANQIAAQKAADRAAKIATSAAGAPADGLGVLQSKEADKPSAAPRAEPAIPATSSPTSSPGDSTKAAAKQIAAADNAASTPSGSTRSQPDFVPTSVMKPDLDESSTDNGLNELRLLSGLGTR